MRALRLLVLALVLWGCGAASSSGATTVAGPASPAEGGEASRAPDAAARIRELESQLALRSAEVRELRAELSARPPVVRIGETRADEATEDEAGFPLAEPEPDDAPRPVLRLYGAAAPAPVPGPAAPAVLPPPPQVTSFARLPVVESVPAIPEHPITVAPAIAPPRVLEDDPVVREYRAALAEVEARRFEHALAALDRFSRAHPDHPYADNAVYWQGEVLYALREYRRALGVLEGLVARYPRGNKVPDALLRIGYCFQRLGEFDRARAAFRRVREEYPDSVAARMASREET